MSKNIEYWLDDGSDEDVPDVSFITLHEKNIE